MNPSAFLPTIAPSDEANRRTIASGHPLDWQPPQPKPLYDLVVLGGGPAGTMAVLTATRAGHTVAVVERNLTGGTCVNFGCTPSKALIRAARAVFLVGSRSPLVGLLVHFTLALVIGGSFGLLF